MKYEKTPIASRIQSSRIKRGLTQEELANELNVTPDTVKSWESGRRKPNQKTLPHLCRILHVTEDCILKGDNSFEKWLSKLDSEMNPDLPVEVALVEMADKLGYYIPCDKDDSEKSYKGFLEYIKLYPDFLQEHNERRIPTMTRNDVNVVIGANDNEIAENFVTGAITIYAKTESDVEKGFQALIERGLIQG